MFTSRAEFRTLLRQDNADYRLTPLGFDLGIADSGRMARMEEKYSKSEAFIDFFKNTSVAPEHINPILSRHESSRASQSDKLFKFFSRPNISMQDMLGLDAVSAHVAENQLDREVLEQVEIQVKYSGYIEKEKNNAAKLTKLEGIRIPENFDYSRLKSLSYEAREKLSQIQPRTISQASRISGVSPNDISVLLVFMGR